MPRSRRYLFFVLILLLATIVRIVGIDSQSLWIDEGFTWNLSQYRDPLTILRLDVHPPLYFAAFTAWVQAAGTSVLAMRYFSLLPSLLSVAVVFQLAREMQRQRGETGVIVPLIAAALMAVCEAETNLSQEARGYTWHVLFACLSIWGFLRWGRLGGKAWLALWALSLIALIYIFYLGAFVGMVQGVYALLFWRDSKQRKKLYQTMGILFACALTLVPWLLLTGGSQTENISHGEVIRHEAYLFWLDDFRKGYFTGQWALTIGLFLLGLIYRRGKKISSHETAILLLLWFGLPLLLTLILNEIVPTYQPRRVSQIVPAIALLMAFGLGNIQGNVRYFLVAALLIYGSFATDFWRFKQPWRIMVKDTAPLIAPATPLLVELGGDDYDVRYHYAEAMPNTFDFLLDEDQPEADDTVIIGLTSWRHLRPDDYEGSLPPILNSQEHWWLFYWSSDTGAIDWLNNFGFERTATITVDFNPDVYLYRYDRLPENPILSYENGLVLRDALIHPNRYVELLWSADNSIDDYISSVFLLNAAGELVAQHDSQPFFGERPMSAWQLGEVVYDPKPLEANRSLDAGLYQVGIVVYHVVDGEILRLRTADGQDSFMLGEMQISD
jgi:hypothetical protein